MLQISHQTAQFAFYAMFDSARSMYVLCIKSHDIENAAAFLRYGTYVHESMRELSAQLKVASLYEQQLDALSDKCCIHIARLEDIARSSQN